VNRDLRIVDVHAHVLPGLDDGPPGLAEAVRMCELYCAEGVATVVATPHFSDPRFPVTPDGVRTAVRRLAEACRDRCVKLEILPGAEVRLRPELIEDLDADRLLTLADGGRYVMIELPPFAAPRIEGLAELLDQRGLTPIISHAERNGELCRKPQRVAQLVQAGFLVQVTGASVTGGFGRGARRAAETLVKSGLAHVIASDAHAPTGLRAPSFGPVLERLVAWVGSDEARALVSDRPAMLVGKDPSATQSRAAGAAAGTTAPPAETRRHRH